MSGARTGEISLDVAWAWDGIPPHPPVAMMNVYNGSARPSRAAVDSWATPTLMGFESAVDRAFAGGDAGEADAAFSIARFDEWGYPRDAGSWCCAHDGNGTPAWALGNIEDYAFRYARRMVVAGRMGPIAGYGNPAAVEAFRRGVQRAGLQSPRWGVGTWGYGEGGGANQPPAFADCEQLQSGNTPGMYPGTDHNWLYEPVATFRPYGLAVTPDAPPAPANLGEPMEIVYFDNPFGKTAILVDGGGLELNRWNSSAEDSVQGCPKAAWDWRNAGGRGSVAMIQVDGLTALALERNLAARKAALTGGGSGVDDPDLDVDGAVAALLALLPASVTEAQIRAVLAAHTS